MRRRRVFLQNKIEICVEKVLSEETLPSGSSKKTLFALFWLGLLLWKILVIIGEK